MANRNYKVFIVEGESREPQIIDNISKIFFSHGNSIVITLPAGENIYMLWRQLKEDDFETDIIEVLRDNNAYVKKKLSGLSRNDFSEIYLFFDYDVHHENLKKDDNSDVVYQMLENFDNETDNGKLFISYPMVEALRDFQPRKCGNGIDCFVQISDMVRYKYISSNRSHNPHFKDYDINVWKDIVGVFIMRLSCLYGLADVMSYDVYSNEVRPCDIYGMEVNKIKRDGVFILSAFPEFLLDYFGVRLWKTCAKQQKFCNCKR